MLKSTWMPINLFLIAQKFPKGKLNTDLIILHFIKWRDLHKNAWAFFFFCVYLGLLLISLRYLLIAKCVPDFIQFVLNRFGNFQKIMRMHVKLKSINLETRFFQCHFLHLLYIFQLTIKWQMHS